MNVWLLAIVGLIYLGVTVNHVLAHNYGMAFFSYALGNVGFILAAFKL